MVPLLSILLLVPELERAGSQWGVRSRQKLGGRGLGSLGCSVLLVREVIGHEITPAEQALSSHSEPSWWDVLQAGEQRAAGCQRLAMPGATLSGRCLSAVRSWVTCALCSSLEVGLWAHVSWLRDARGGGVRKSGVGPMCPWSPCLQGSEGSSMLSRAVS